jgi:hypothetical protein
MELLVWKFDGDGGRFPARSVRRKSWLCSRLTVDPGKVSVYEPETIERAKNEKRKWKLLEPQVTIARWERGLEVTTQGKGHTAPDILN